MRSQAGPDHLQQQQQQQQQQQWKWCQNETNEVWRGSMERSDGTSECERAWSQNHVQMERSTRCPDICFSSITSLLRRKCSANQGFLDPTAQERGEGPDEITQSQRGGKCTAAWFCVQSLTQGHQPEKPRSQGNKSSIFYFLYYKKKKKKNYTLLYSG